LDQFGLSQAQIAVLEKDFKHEKDGKHMSRVAVIWASAAMLAMGIYSSAEAKRGWTVIATQSVGKGGDQDTVYVPDERKYSKVRICVYGRPVLLKSFSVRFHNGKDERLDVRANFQPGTCSRAVDLRGNRHRIDWVMLDYNRLPGQGAPSVRIEAQ
jgi:hypothetical protein